MWGMGRFSLRRLLIATTLIAVGIGLLQLPANLFTIAFGGPLIGAGVLTPLRRPWVGALLGLVLTPFGAVAYTLWYWSVYGNHM